MTSSERMFEAVGINDTAEGKCGVALLLVRKTEDPESVYLLDPDSGPQSPFSNAEIEAMASEQEVCLLTKQMIVNSKEQAFYIDHTLQTAFKDIISTDIADMSVDLKAIKLSRTKNEQTIIGIAARPVLVQWREQIAGMMLEKMDVRVSQELSNIPDHEYLESVLKKIEQWGRCGALCAGSGSLKKYWEFMKRVGAVMMLRPDQHDRLVFTHERMVHRHFPEISFMQFCDQAEILFRSWKMRGGIYREIGAGDPRDLHLFCLEAEKVQKNFIHTA